MAKFNSPTSPPLEVSPTSTPAAENPPNGQSSSTRDKPFSSPKLKLPSTAIDLDDSVRQPSIQFLAHRNSELPRGEPKAVRNDSASKRRRMSSPPPPSVFQSRVSFDTFPRTSSAAPDNADITSFTLAKKHKDYVFTKRSRTFLCGLDANDYSEYALEWLIDELVDDGDEVVCLRVIDSNSEVVVGGGKKGEAKYREEAEALMKSIESRNRESKAINLILEFAVGKVEKMFTRMIKLYEPAILIVGTRGRSLGGIQGLLPGSVSKFCLQNSPVPVIVVRPNKQRAYSKRKREKDAARHGYRDLLDKAGKEDGVSGHLLDGSNRGSQIFEFTESGDIVQGSAEDEARAVAEAIGMKGRMGSLAETRDTRSSPLVNVQSAPSEELDAVTTPDSEDGGSELGSPEEQRVMKSPELQDLDSPVLSGEEESPDDDPESPELTANRPAMVETSGGIAVLKDDDGGAPLNESSKKPA